VLDLPTGSGKTAALDIALFHLALEARKAASRRAPVRIAFVVDRRLIVDDAYERARILACKLKDSLDHPAAADAVVLKVAQALYSLAGVGQPPLVARCLRGGVPHEDDWARTPVQPTILCSTVDQVGSRLLFRGYGVSDAMKPIHAGLLGSDCMLLVDEAHLAEPFRQTLAAVGRLRGGDRERAPFGFAVLTATPALEAGRAKEATFTLSAPDEAHPVLARRIAASKPARLVEIANKQGVDSESRRADALAAETKAMIGKLRSSGLEQPAVGVVVNRVVRARGVFERLTAELRDAADVMLLIGPARSVDRDSHSDDLDPIRTRRLDARRQLSSRPARTP
jgi:CRISPR-associated endonuclease/helicase Cas3